MHAKFLKSIQTRNVYFLYTMLSNLNLYVSVYFKGSIQLNPPLCFLFYHPSSTFSLITLFFA